jgi:hypothetical protein
MSVFFNKWNPFSKKEVTINEGKMEQHESKTEDRAVLKASTGSTPYPNRKWEIEELKKASQQQDTIISGTFYRK